MIIALDCDIFAVCETFLRNDINVSDYIWSGHNRSNIHSNARCTSSFKCYRVSFSRVMQTIKRIEKILAKDSDVNVAYHEFVSLKKSEMAEKLKVKKPDCIKPHKSRNKPY